jgi:hypothetical protein
MNDRIPRPAEVILISGPLGSGKTSVAIELGACLEEIGITHAVLDLDWLCWVGPNIEGDRLLEVLADNLAAVATRYRAEGIDHLVLARALTDQAQMEVIRSALDPARLVTVTLEVPLHLAAARLVGRDQGSVLEANLKEQEQLSATNLLVTDLRVENWGRPIRSTALDILRRSGWIGDSNEGNMPHGDADSSDR